MKKILAIVLSMALSVGGLSLVTLAADTKPSLDTSHYSYLDLVEMVTDMERISLLPPPGEKSIEESSWDRGSQYIQTVDKYINWDWNGDNVGSYGSVTTDHGTGLLAVDIEGAGVIFRSWSAMAQNGSIEFIIDGESVIYQSFDSFFKPEGRFAGLDKMCYITEAQGRNNLIPISFSESCQVVLHNGWGAYYQFTYTQFPDATVETYPKEFTAEQKNALNEVNTFLKSGMGTSPNTATEADDEWTEDFVIPAGGDATVLDSTGEGAVKSFKVRVNEALTYNEMWDALQEMTVSMYWDGSESPAVWAPLGDFFGTPCGDYYLTVPMGLDKQGWMYSYFYMPYADGAKIVIGNDGEADKNISVEAVTTPLAYDVDLYGRFHAKWNNDEKQPTRTDVWPDYTVLKTEGRGRFLGFGLHVFEKGNHGWWGEGDEKFFVDGEKFPFSFGTGSEDYFGYAWCDATIFNERPFHAQNHNEGGIGGRGNKANIRFQIADNVPFQTQFDAYIEKYLSDEKAEYAVTPYWYLSPDGVDDYAPVSLETRSGWYERVAQTETYLQLESQLYTPTNGVATVDGGDVILTASQSSAEKPEADASIEFDFELLRPYTAEFKILPARTKHSGVYQFYLDGEPIGEPIDLYYNTNGVLKPNYINFGQMLLTKGNHTLTAIAVDTNAPAEDQTYFYNLRLDYILLDEAPLPNTYKVIEAEDMQFVKFSAGNASIQAIGDIFPGGTWSKNKQVWWTGGKTGATMDYTFTLNEPIDNVFLSINLTKASDYGIVQLILDGEKIGDPIDCYETFVTNTGYVSLGKHDLAAGTHTFTTNITGKNPKAVGYMVGFDAILIKEFSDQVAYAHDIENISGKIGTKFKVPVQISSFPSDDKYRSIEGVMQLPDGVKLVNAVPSNFITYKNFDFEVDSANKLRYAFLAEDNGALKFDDRLATSILDLTFELTKTFPSEDAFEMTFDSFVVKNRHKDIVFTVESPSVTIGASVALKGYVKQLYLGDGVDLVPSGKQAVSVQFINMPSPTDVSLFGKPFYYSPERSEKAMTPVYVGLIDADVDLEALTADTFTIGEQQPEQMKFGDVDSNNKIDAQDALKVVSAWLRKINAPNEKEILIMNVIADSRIDTTDAIAMVDNYINGLIFGIITK